MTLQPGDKVECAHDFAWQEEHRQADIIKGKKLGITNFMGNAAAYMHLDEAYVVQDASRGVRLRGFCARVSAKDLRISTKPVYR